MPGWCRAGGVAGDRRFAVGRAARDRRDGERCRSARIIGYASMVVASLSTAFNLCWRVRLRVAGRRRSGFRQTEHRGHRDGGGIRRGGVGRGPRRVQVAAAQQQGVQGSRPSRSGPRRWSPGSWSGCFPSAATSTHSTASHRTPRRPASGTRVTWPGPRRGDLRAAAPSHGYRSTDARSPWRAAARKALLLIAVWCLGSVLMRITDLAVAVTSELPVLALRHHDAWPRSIWPPGCSRSGFGSTWPTRRSRARVTTSLCGLLCALSHFACDRGRRAGTPVPGAPNGGGWTNPVYGNDLAQQITSTFDVALCGLALGILAAAVISGRPRPDNRESVAPRTPVPPSRPPPVPPSAAATTRIPTRPGRGQRPLPSCPGRPDRPGSSAVTTPPPARSTSHRRRNPGSTGHRTSPS